MTTIGKPRIFHDFLPLLNKFQNCFSVGVSRQSRFHVLSIFEHCLSQKQKYLLCHNEMSGFIWMYSIFGIPEGGIYLSLFFHVFPYRPMKINNIPTGSVSATNQPIGVNIENIGVCFSFTFIVH